MHRLSIGLVRSLQASDVDNIGKEHRAWTQDQHGHLLPLRQVRGHIQGVNIKIFGQEVNRRERKDKKK